MLAAMELVREVVARGRPQLFCACFGHQLLAAALGGAVRSSDAFVFEAEDVVLGGPWRAWAEGAGIAADASWSGELRILESHGDFVATLPPGATLLGSSPTCINEVVAVGPSVLSVQGASPS